MRQHSQVQHFIFDGDINQFDSTLGFPGEGPSEQGPLAPLCFDLVRTACSLAQVKMPTSWFDSAKDQLFSTFKAPSTPARNKDKDGRFVVRSANITSHGMGHAATDHPDTRSTGLLQLPMTPRCIWAIQEHHLMGNKLTQVTQRLRTKGIKVWLHDGLQGHTNITDPEQSHTRAGVGFMWGPGIQLVSEPCVVIPGRCSLGKFLLPKGCIISVYSLYADVRSSTTAKDQLSKVIEIARKDPTPTIIAGDFNLHPEEVEQTVKALAGTRNDLMLWIPPKPTYFSGEHTSTLDYMLTVNMPRALLHGFRICPEVDIGQHKAIEASLGSTQVEEEFDVWKKGLDHTTCLCWDHTCPGLMHQFSIRVHPTWTSMLHLKNG